jgi:HAD superfamily hydrolase (TIGR01509 family)
LLQTFFTEAIMARKQAIVFDFDGVLANTYQPGFIVELARQHGHKIPDDIHERLHLHWGKVGPLFIEESFDLPAEEAAALYATWERHDQDNDVALMDQAAEMVTTLADHYKLCILSSRHRTSLIPVLKRADIFHRFLHITAHEDTLHHKPDPLAFQDILRTLRAFGITKPEMLFVGDTACDLEAGLLVGIDTIIVETGPYPAQRERHPHHPGFVLPSVLHVPGWLEALHALEPA